MRSNLGKDGLQKITFPSTSSLIYNITGGFFFFFFFLAFKNFLAMLCSTLWALSSLTRDGAHTYLHWEHGVLTTELPEKSPRRDFKWKDCLIQLRIY